jgi:hypothetical protein
MQKLATKMQVRKSRPVGLIGIPLLIDCHPEATALSSLKDPGKPREASRGF